MENNEELSNSFRKFFKMPLSPVAITVHIQDTNSPSPDTSNRFCYFVRNAAKLRESFTLKEKNLSNFTATIILGFADPKYTEIYPRIKPSKTKAVTVRPLELEKGTPDVVVIISDPETMMKVFQVYHQMSKERIESSCTSEGSAIAGEATAIPYMEDKPNLTLLCGGARSIGGFKDDELAMGMPYDIFTKLVEQLSEPNVTDALCGCIMDNLPSHLVEPLKEMNFDKGTDHFHGYYRGKALRLYLDQDESGSVKKMTVYLPLKFRDESQAQKAMETAKPIITGNGFANKRENWLDIGMIKEFDEGLEKIATDREEFKEMMNSIFTEFIGIVKDIKSQTR